MKHLRSILSIALILCSQSCSPDRRDVDSVAGDLSHAADQGNYGTTVKSEDDLNIAYSIQGSGSPTLVFIHGWLCNRTYWSNQLKALSDDRTVVTVDLPGHGQSGMARKEWTIQAYGRDIKNLAEALDLEQVILVGHSMGSLVGLEAAQLMSGRVIGVIGVASFYDVGNPTARLAVDSWLEAYERNFYDTCSFYVNYLLDGKISRELGERIRFDMCTSSSDTSLSILRKFAVYDVRSSMKSTPVPIHSINSDNLQTKIEGNRRYSPQFDVSIINGGSSFPMLEQPVHFNQILETVINERFDVFRHNASTHDQVKFSRASRPPTSSARLSKSSAAREPGA